MISWLESSIQSRIVATGYRYRFLVLYIIFGIFSLIVEMIALEEIKEWGTAEMAAYPLAISCGILAAFWFNVRFNFKVPKPKRKKALIWFAAISVFSGCLQYLLRGVFLPEDWSYEQGRFVVSGLVFFMAYLLHRRFSFVDQKQVGVAVYANGLEDIKTIFDKVGLFPDFIHVDIIDHTFGEKDLKPKAYRLETIRAYWPKKPLHVHLMSRIPDFWLPEVLPYADLIYLHVESEKSLDKAFERIRAEGKSTGLAIMLETPLNQLDPYLANVDTLLMLSIKKPGRSGQKFEFGVLEKIKQSNNNPVRKKLKLCVDGGIDRETVQLLGVEMVVSGSHVLNSKSPKKEIIRLQSASNLETF